MHPILAKRLVSIGSPPAIVKKAIQPKKGINVYIKHNIDNKKNKKINKIQYNRIQSQYTSSTAYPLVITFLVIYQPCFEITFKTVECVLGKCTGCECVCVCVCVGGWCCVKLVCKQK